MSLRLLKKQVGDESSTSDVAKSVVQPSKQKKGKGRGYPGESGGSGGKGGSGADGNTQADGPRVMAPSVGRFQGSSVQAAHVAATKKAAAEDARAKEQEWKIASELAVKSGLGLRNVEEKKQKEEEERAARRQAARAKRKGEVAQREVDEMKSLAECEEQAWCDSEAHDRVKYEAALIVRIAMCFGSSGVWTKITEARSRGAEIPLDAKKVYLLAHPDKCPLPEAADATAILNAQRPPEMSESHAAGPAVGADGSKAAVAARVKAARVAAEAGSELHKIDPEDDQVCTFAQLVQKYKGTYTEEELQGYWEVECRPLERAADPAPEQKPSDEQQTAPRDSKEQKPPPAAPVAVAVDAEEDSLQKVDPEDNQLCTFKELQAKYSGTYSLEEVKEYWDIECSTPRKPDVKRSLPGKRPAPAASALHQEPAVPTAPAEPETAEDAVPGLSAWLQHMNLGSYSAAASQWAEEQGAVGLDELVESLDDFAVDLKLKPMEVKRLKAQAEGAASAVASGMKNQKEPSAVHGPPSAVQDVTPPSKSSGHETRSRAEPPAEQAAAAVSYYTKSETKSEAVASKPDKASVAGAASTPAPSAPDEKRIDPETGKAVTLQDLFSIYSRKYSIQEIDEYWESCEPACSGSSKAEVATSAVASEVKDEKESPTVHDAPSAAQTAAPPNKSSKPKAHSQRKSPAGQSAAPESSPGATSLASVSSAPADAAIEEKRVDPETGEAVTLQDLFSFYGRKYSVQEIDEYWETCKPADATTVKENRGGKETRSVRDFLLSGGRKRY